MSPELFNPWPDEPMDPEQRITVIDGPPPEIVPPGDIWADQLLQNRDHFWTIMVTKVPAPNPYTIIERCKRAWQDKRPIYLHYTSPEFDPDTGYQRRALIYGARVIQTDEGEMLLLYTPMVREGMEFDPSI